MTTLAIPQPVRFRRSPWRARVPSWSIIVAVAFVLWAFVVSPMLLTLERSLVNAGAAYAPFRDGWSGAVPQALMGSVLLSLLTALSAGTTGLLLAVLFHRWEFPLRRFFHALALSPLALPPFIGAAAFAKLYGFGGVVPSWLGIHVLGVDPNSLAVDGLAGVLLVHTVTMYPYFYLPAAGALRRVDASLEEAASSLGASSLQVWTRVVLPMLTPALISGALLTFMASMGSYTAPVLFGVNRVLTRQIALANDNGDLAFASGASVVLCVFSILFLVGFRAYERRASYWTTSKGAACLRQRRVGRAWEVVLVAISISVTAFMVLPMLLIFVLAFSIDGTWREALLPSEYGLHNVERLLNDPAAWAPIANSLQMSALAAGAATIVGLCCAYVVARMQTRGRTALEIAIMLPWALPGTVVAFNLIAAFNEPSPVTFGYTLVGTYAIVPLAYVVRFAPIVFRSTTASLAQLDPSLEEAARSLGASPWCAFRRIVLPLLSRAIAAGALLAFVGGIGEFVATTLLHAQERYKPLSIAVAEEYYRGNLGTAAAWGAVQIVLVLVVLMIARTIESRDEPIKVSAA
jgi:iron(III) transport system permease protein